jgi:hypothetical protein
MKPFPSITPECMLSSLEVHHEDAAVSGLTADHPEEEEEEGIIVAVVVKDLLADLLTLKNMGRPEIPSIASLWRT